MKQLLSPFIYTFILSFFVVNAYSQRKPDDPKHENHYSVQPISTDKVTLDFVSSQSQQEFTLTKIKITNKTEDYLIFKTSEARFKYEFGEFKPAGGLFKSENVKIAPKDDKSVTLKAAGEAKNYHVSKLTFIPNGISSVSLNGKVQEAADFKLPAASNDVIAGTFKCTVDKIDKETKETKASFKCIYNGNAVGIVDANQIVVKIKSGQEFVNENREDKPLLLFPGDDFKIVAKFHVPGKTEDMQFANMDIVWKGTFKESKMEPIELKPAEFILDQGLTDGKNK